MPPRFKFTKEEITDAALEITEESGIKALTARSLAERLGSSVKPIFGLFENMEAVLLSVMNRANKIYLSYLENDMSENKYPPYKASGMAYIRFASERRELFKLLFMRDRSGESITENRESIRPIIDMIIENLGIGEEKAYLFHLEMWLYVHGIATMIATGYLNWDMDFVSASLTDAYMGLKHRFTESD